MTIRYKDVLYENEYGLHCGTKEVPTPILDLLYAEKPTGVLYNRTRNGTLFAQDTPRIRVRLAEEMIGGYMDVTSTLEDDTMKLRLNTHYDMHGETNPSYFRVDAWLKQLHALDHEVSVTDKFTDTLSTDSVRNLTNTAEDIAYLLDMMNSHTYPIILSDRLDIDSVDALSVLVHAVQRYADDQKLHSVRVNMIAQSPDSMEFEVTRYGVSDETRMHIYYDDTNKSVTLKASSRPVFGAPTSKMKHVQAGTNTFVIGPGDTYQRDQIAIAYHEETFQYGAPKSVWSFKDDLAECLTSMNTNARRRGQVSIDETPSIGDLLSPEGPSM